MPKGEEVLGCSLSGRSQIFAGSLYYTVSSLLLLIRRRGPRRDFLRVDTPFPRLSSLESRLVLLCSHFP